MLNEKKQSPMAAASPKQENAVDFSTVVKHAQLDKREGRAKSMAIFVMLGIVVLAGIAVAIMYGLKLPPFAASNTEDKSSKTIVFAMSSTMDAFMGVEVAFLNEVAYAGEMDVKDASVSSMEMATVQLTSGPTMVLLVYVDLTGESSAALDAIAAKISASVTNLDFASMNVVQFWSSPLEVEIVNMTPGPTTPAPTTPAPTTPAPTTSPFDVYINCGSPMPYVDNMGVTWAADNQYFIGGVTWSKAVTGNPIYDTERFFQNLVDNEGYHIPVPQAGAYNVKLVFVELAFAAPEMRKFGILIEGVNPIVGYIDIFAQTNTTGAPFVVDYQATVSDGVLDINVIKVKNNPKITAIEVHAVSV
jgi:hypothetical protein